MKKIKTIDGLNEIIYDYDTYILDQWGVIHDGKKGYIPAIKCVDKLIKKNKKIIIISNSSKRKNKTIERLPKLGFNPKNFFEVMTSGEMIWQNLNNKKSNFTKKLGRNFFFLFDKFTEDSKDFIKDLKDYNHVEKIEEADFILACTTQQGSNTIDYVPILLKAIEKNLPFICANPDYETVENKSKNLIICMGTIADLYNNLGGKTFSLGKPSIKIYQEATKKIDKINKKKILAVGDSIFHDIKGANLFGIDSLLITSGIHQSHFHKTDPIWDTNINSLKINRILPKFLCSKFKL
tara:strand:+ start:1956 stop:2837 length:882 start_codon:yes stop_codon:yes gene_type:complete